MADARSKIIAILKKIPLFTGLYEDEFVILSSLFIAKEFQPERIIFRETDASMCMYVLLAGAVELSTIESGPIYTLKPGEIFGEIGLISQNPRTATAKTAVKTALMEITREDYNTLMSKYPHISNIMMRNIALSLSNHIVRMTNGDSTEVVDPKKYKMREPRPVVRPKIEKKDGPKVVKRAG